MLILTIVFILVNVVQHDIFWEPMSRLAEMDKVVVVADVFQAGGRGGPVAVRRDLEQTEPSVLADLLGAIAALDLEHVHYRNPSELAQHASTHKADVILSIYGGERSRNRMLLTPAVCETFGLAYVGLDAFGRALAQDKEASKMLARSCGLLTPRARVIRRAEELHICTEFPAPYVVKPLHEGSSIGISQENLIHNPLDGVRLAASLLQRFDQPVLVESFVAGREISFTAVETEAGLAMRLAEIVVDGQPDYFVTRLFDAEEKLRRLLPRRAARVSDDLVANVDWDAAYRLLRAIGHFGYARIDGRVVGNRFHFIELTPDAFIGPLGQMAAGFIGSDTTYTDFIGLVLHSAVLRPRDQSASG